MLIDFNKIEEKMGSEKIDVLLVSSPENLFYISGYRALEPSITLAFTILIKGLDPILLTPISEIGSILSTDCWIKDRRFYGQYYIENAPEQKVVAKGTVEAIDKILKEEGLSRGIVGIEESNISQFLYKHLRKALPQAEFKDADGLLYNLRIIKSSEEVNRIRKAVKVSEKALLKAFEVAGEGADELDVSEALKKTLISEGAEWTFVEMASGFRSGIPNEQPSSYIMKRGDVIRIDFGTKLNGYCSDISRNTVIREAFERHRKIHEALFKGEKAAIETVKPGKKLSDIFKIGQKTIRREGLQRFTRYNLGHGIGLSTHEPPIISPENDQIVREGMVFTIEVPYYIYNFGGFNIEDVLLATNGGCELLSTLGRELFIL